MSNWQRNDGFSHYTYKKGDTRKAIEEGLQLIWNAAWQSNTTRTAILVLLGLIVWEVAWVNDKIRSSLAQVLVKNNPPHIVQDMYPGTPEFKNLHHNRAIWIQHGDMGIYDYATRLMLGEKRFKQEKVEEFIREEGMAEQPVTDEALAEVQKNY